MKIIFTNSEAEKLFHDALCNGLSYVESGYGLRLIFNIDDYDKAKESIKNNNVCFEDIIIQILKDGKSITIEDIEGEGENTSTIYIDDIYDRLPNTPLRHLFDAINEDGDAITADVIIQQVFYEDIIFG